MPRKYLLTTTFTIICLIAILLFAYNLMLQPKIGDNPEAQNEGPDNTDIMNGGNMFVIPESPLGTFGIISISTLALGLFALKKRRKTKPPDCIYLFFEKPNPIACGFACFRRRGMSHKEVPPAMQIDDGKWR